ncbi:hypothetical protein NPIL_237461 [Nephila pilipes]|uniref:Uncharacterized protein n=1 Tax=Nephila pilipes TaxID=299642 RepID=A0A8X6PLA5_NEPPI|nr:hypothetical protein NPIL_237461 [Nephila pilipes]
MNSHSVHVQIFTQTACAESLFTPEFFVISCSQATICHHQISAPFNISCTPSSLGLPTLLTLQGWAVIFESVQLHLNLSYTNSIFQIPSESYIV